MQEPSAKRAKSIDHGRELDCCSEVRNKLMQTVAHPMWTWCQDGFLNNVMQFVHAGIHDEAVQYHADINQRPAVIEPYGSSIVSLVVSEDGLTQALLRDCTCPLKLKMLGGFSVGHIIPPQSIVHAFVFLNKCTDELQLSMFDISHMQQEFLSQADRRARNRVLLSLVQKAWQQIQISATKTLLQVLKSKGESWARVGAALQLKCDETQFNPMLLEDIAWCKASGMQEIARELWEKLPELHDVRFPGGLSANIHWQPIMPMEQARTIDAGSYEQAGAPVYKSVLMLPEVNDEDPHCRRIL